MSTTNVIITDNNTPVVIVQDPVNKIVKTDGAVKVVNRQYGVVRDNNVLVLPVISESTPNGYEGLMWFQPVTQVLSVYSSGVWTPETNDDGFY